MPERDLAKRREVGLRIVHSLVQATVHIVMIRFAIFMAASVVLAVRATLLVF
jgi:hypothetical protein